MNLKFKIERDGIIKKFVEEEKQNKNALRSFIEWNFIHPDIEVDFSNKVLDNFIEISSDYYLSLKKDKKIHFLKAISCFFDIALSIKLYEFEFTRDPQYWKDYPFYFKLPLSLIDNIKEMNKELSLVDINEVQSKVILVEGDSEIAFLEILQQHSANFSFDIYSYGGKGALQNLVHYVKSKSKEGIKSVVIYDLDGSGKTLNVKKLKERCDVYKDFAFSKDFEDSFPPNILYSAIKKYINKYNIEKDIHISEEVVNSLMKNNNPFVDNFKIKYDIELSKVKLAEILGGEIDELLYENWDGIVNSKKKHKYEIYNFIKFLVKL
ncbi:MAG TPA: hypothetical protein PKU93_01015 [Candidatus Pacearchaeota archaeon]|nr:hypothetical protein [Candidatus Pacearchaeota archaeon]